MDREFILAQIQILTGLLKVAGDSGNYDLSTVTSDKLKDLINQL